VLLGLSCKFVKAVLMVVVVLMRAVLLVLPDFAAPVR
jgi:hypothetical protein